MTLSRRKLITTGLAAAAGVAGLGVADKLANRYGLVPPDCGGVFGPGETLTYAAQRLLTRHSMAREFSRSQISAKPFGNAVVPPTDAFKLLQTGGFKDWRLTVDGLVERPTAFSLADLQSLPIKNQITEVVCEEGWSYVAEWIGTPLREVLRETGVKPGAKYLVYISSEKDQWDSLDMAEAVHPQTLLTMGMNNGDLPVPFWWDHAACAAPTRLQEHKVHQPHHRNGRHQEVWQGSRLGISGIRLLLVRGDLRSSGQWSVISGQVWRHPAFSF